MYALPPDIAYLSRYDVNRFGRNNIERFGDLPPGIGDLPADIQAERQAGLGGFFSSPSREYQIKFGLAMHDMKIRHYMGYPFTIEQARKERNYMQALQFAVAKERAKRSGFGKVMEDFAMPAALAIMSGGMLTPVALALAGASAAYQANRARKAEKMAIEGANKLFAARQTTQGVTDEIEDMQAEIVRITNATGVPKEAVNAMVQDAANKQEKQKKTAATLLLGGAGIVAVVAMAA